MPFSPKAGKEGSVLVGTVEYAFGKWSVAMKTNLPKVNNFTSDYQQVVAGITSATLTLEGPWDTGNMPLTCGNSYQFTCTVDGTTSIVITALVSEITPSDDIDDAARVKVTAESNGTFTAAIT